MCEETGGVLLVLMRKYPLGFEYKSINFNCNARIMLIFKDFRKYAVLISPNDCTHLSH